MNNQEIMTYILIGVAAFCAGGFLATLNCLRIIARVIDKLEELE